MWSDGGECGVVEGNVEGWKGGMEVGAGEGYKRWMRGWNGCTWRGRGAG